MAMNRVQFQPGLSLPAFLASYGSEGQCERALEAARWPDGFVCPRCAGKRCSRFQRHAQAYWQCSHCRQQSSLRSGTVFEHSRLPLTTWLLAMYLLSQSKTNLSALELMRHLGVSYPTAWRMKHTLMQAMAEREAGRRLGGVVQLDDAYLGGERNGGKAGRGSENMRPFVIAVETTQDGRPRQAVFDPVSGCCHQTGAGWRARQAGVGTEPGCAVSGLHDSVGPTRPGAAGKMSNAEKGADPWESLQSLPVTKPSSLTRTGRSRRLPSLSSWPAYGSTESRS